MSAQNAHATREVAPFSERLVASLHEAQTLLGDVERTVASQVKWAPDALPELQKLDLVSQILDDLARLLAELNMFDVPSDQCRQALRDILVLERMRTLVFPDVPPINDRGHDQNYKVELFDQGDRNP